MFHLHSRSTPTPCIPVVWSDRPADDLHVESFDLNWGWTWTEGLQMQYIPRDVEFRNCKSNCLMRRSHHHHHNEGTTRGRRECHSINSTLIGRPLSAESILPLPNHQPVTWMTHPVASEVWLVLNVAGSIPHWPLVGSGSESGARGSS